MDQSQMEERVIDVAHACITAEVPQCHRCTNPCDDSIAVFHTSVHNQNKEKQDDSIADRVDPSVAWR